MLDKNVENVINIQQGKSVNKHFQFHIQKETECGSHMKIATSIQYLSIKVGEQTTTSRDV